MGKILTEPRHNMATRKRLSPEESRTAALEAARGLLIETGPQSVTLKAVAQRIGRTHANLLHHFGSASGLQKSLAAHLATTVCETIKDAVRASRAACWPACGRSMQTTCAPLANALRMATYSGE